jgi:phosphomannomutase
LEGGGRVLVRPSGTEPKLKIYVDLTDTSADERELSEQADRVAAEMAAYLAL